MKSQILKHSVVLGIILSVLASNSLAITPEDVLPDGQDTLKLSENVSLRKGSVGALLANMKEYDALYQAPRTKDVKSQLHRLEQEIEQLIPGLIQAGFFDLFPLREWASNDDNVLSVAKKVVHIKVLQYHQQTS